MSHSVTEFPLWLIWDKSKFFFKLVGDSFLNLQFCKKKKKKNPQHWWLLLNNQISHNQVESNELFFLDALEIFYIIFLLKITLTVSLIWNLKIDNSTDLLVPYHHTAILTGIFCVITFQIKAWFVSLCIKFSSFIFFKSGL